MPVDMRRAFAEAKERGWSHLEFARQLRIHPSALYRIKNGDRTPSIRFYERMKAAFPDLSVDDLIQVTEDDRGDPRRRPDAAPPGE